MSSVSPEGPFLESLEARVTPAVYLTDVPNGDPTIVDPSTVTYRDVDGDMVTVKFSKGIIDSQETLDAIFDFAEAVDIGYGVKGYALKGISLADYLGDAKLLRNLDISVTAETATLNGVDQASVEVEPGKFLGYTDFIQLTFGDGHANLGFINAAGVDLGSVSIDGNLGKIAAGDNKVSNGGLRSLTVESLGALGNAAEALAGDYTSVINGSLKNLDIAGNVSGALLKIQGGKHGDLLNAHIGGNILGGASVDAGAIKAEGTIKTLVLDGSLLGTEAANTGLIYAADDIKSLSIGGNLKGGSGALSGSVAVGDGISKISIAGNLLGGGGSKSGSVVSFEAKIGKIDFDGLAITGTGTDSGEFLSFVNKPAKSIPGYTGGGGASGSISGTLNFNGGTIQGVGYNVDYIRDFSTGATYYGDVSGATFETGGFIIGGVTKIGGGTLVLGGGGYAPGVYLPVDVTGQATLSLDFAGIDTVGSLFIGSMSTSYLTGIWGAV